MSATPNVTSYVGWVMGVADCELLLWAAHLRLIPSLTKRPSQYERRENVRSGAIFVICLSGDSDMDRWTENRIWTQSRPRGRQGYLVRVLLGFQCCFLSFNNADIL
jgi:hypothetical protein